MMTSGCLPPDYEAQQKLAVRVNVDCEVDSSWGTILGKESLLLRFGGLPRIYARDEMVAGSRRNEYEDSFFRPRVALGVLSSFSMELLAGCDILGILTRGGIPCPKYVLGWESFLYLLPETSELHAFH